MKKILKRKSVWMIWIMVALLIYITCNVISICRYSHIYETKKCDAAIILGAQTNEDGVSEVYKQRFVEEKHNNKNYNEYRRRYLRSFLWNGKTQI